MRVPEFGAGVFGRYPLRTHRDLQIFLGEDFSFVFVVFGRL